MMPGVDENASKNNDNGAERLPRPSGSRQGAGNAPGVPSRPKPASRRLKDDKNSRARLAAIRHQNAAERGVATTGSAGALPSKIRRKANKSLAPNTSHVSKADKVPEVVPVGSGPRPPHTTGQMPAEERLRSWQKDTTLTRLNASAAPEPEVFEANEPALPDMNLPAETGASSSNRHQGVSTTTSVPGAHRVGGVGADDSTQASMHDEPGALEVVADRANAAALSAYLAPSRTRRSRRPQANRAPAAIRDDGIVYEGVAVREEGCFGRHRKVCCIAIVLISAVAIVAGSILATTLTQGKEECHMPAPTTIEGNVTKLVFSISGSEICNKTSPQGQALHWLLHSDTYPLPSKNEKILQRYILAVLYYALNGNDWKDSSGYLGASDECSGWFGVHCSHSASPESRQIIDLNLRKNYMKGSLPSEIIHLHSLDTLRMEENLISGPIPHDIGIMRKLRVLRLSGNRITGTIPTSLGQLTELEECSIGLAAVEGDELGYNVTENNPSLVGTIPTTIGMLDKLRWLSLSANLLTGQIPSELGKLSQLQGLYLYYNNLSGPIPTELGNLASLESLKLYWNSLSGTIPTEFGRLGRLSYLGLHMNSLLGTVPSEVAKLSSLEMVYLDENWLSGSMPSEIWQLSQLDVFSLSSNHLTGSVPTEIGNMTKLKVFRVESNRLSGEIPDELYSLPRLVSLHLSNNKFTGTLSSRIASIGAAWAVEDKARKKVIHLHDNGLLGTIPASLALIDSLAVLTLHGNNFSGTLPEAICKLDVGATNGSDYTLNLLTSDCDNVDCSCSGACMCLDSEVETECFEMDGRGCDEELLWDSVTSGGSKHSIGRLVGLIIGVFATAIL